MEGEIEKLRLENLELKKQVETLMAENKKLDYRIYGDEPNVSREEYDSTYKACLNCIIGAANNCENPKTDYPNNHCHLNINNLSKRDSESFYDKLRTECLKMYGEQISMQYTTTCGYIAINTWYYTKDRLRKMKK